MIGFYLIVNFPDGFTHVAPFVTRGNAMLAHKQIKHWHPDSFSCLVKYK